MGSPHQQPICQLTANGAVPMELSRCREKGVGVYSLQRPAADRMALAFSFRCLGILCAQPCG
jgi:hypothetical protein